MLKEPQDTERESHSNQDIGYGNRIRAVEIKLEIVEDELILMKQRFDNLWEIYQTTENADSEFKRKLLALVSK